MIEKVLVGLCEHARPIMLEVVRPDSCVAMTRVACEVLDHFGFAAAPLNVEAIVINRPYRDRIESGILQVPLSDDDLAAGAWAVGIGIEEQRLEKIASGNDDAVGHVVAVMGKYLIDLSLDQASRPQKGIVLTPRVFEFDAVVEAGATTGTYSLNDGDCYVAYKLRPDLATWRDSPDWRQGRERYRTQIGQTIRAIARNG